MIIKIPTQVGNPIIRTNAKEVKIIKSKEVQKIIKDLVDSMRHHDLVGMAAPQIGKSVRIFVTEIRKTKNRSPKVIDGLKIFINPTIKSNSDKEILGYEGCGSVAEGNLFGKVNRSESITVQAFNERGEKYDLNAKGLLARVIQHEIDHLNGNVFLDWLTDKNSLMSGVEYRKKFKK